MYRSTSWRASPVSDCNMAPEGVIMLDSDVYLDVLASSQSVGVDPEGVEVRLLHTTYR